MEEGPSATGDHPHGLRPLRDPGDGYGRPYIFHEEVVKIYPPGHFKKKGKHPRK